MGQPDSLTYCTVLSACGESGAIGEGRKLHAELLTDRQDVFNDHVVTALISMYARCNQLHESEALFAQHRDQGHIGPWNAMVAAYGQHGLPEKGLALFKELVNSALRAPKPNDVTFVSVLNACSHAGLVDEARAIFGSMQRFDIAPDSRHYGCMVDVLSRAGYITEAEQMIAEHMPLMSQPDSLLVAWKSLLAAAKRYQNVAVAERAAAHIFELHPHDSAGYVLMGNAYSRTSPGG